MKVTYPESDVTESDGWVRGCQTAAASDGELAVTLSPSDEDAWRQVFKKLAYWAEHPEELNDPDEGLEAPSPRAIFNARELARLLWSAKSAPTRVVPDGGGGISFEWSEGDSSEYFEVSHDGDIEVMLFVGQKLVQRRPIRL